MSTDIKLSKAQIPKITQSGEFLGSLLSKIAGKKVTVFLAAVSAINAGIQKKIHGSGTTTLKFQAKKWMT